MQQSQTSTSLKVALVSSGLSHVMRGYETFVWDLYTYLTRYLESQSLPVDLTLLKGSGNTEVTAKNVLSLSRSSGLSKLFIPGGGQAKENKRYRLEQFSMALAGHVMGIWKQYDVLHCCDPNLSSALVKLKNEFHLNYQVVFANCGPMMPEHYQQFDHIQEFTPQYVETAVEFGLPKEMLTLIPMGVDLEQFQSILSKPQLREKWGIPPNQYVVVSVASIDEPFKRLQFLIDSLARLNDSEVFLLMVGQNQGTDYANKTIKLAEEKLAGRYKQLTVPYADVQELYALSDLFVLASLQEGFGKVYLEAMASGLPILTHDCQNTQWITGSEYSRVDMEDVSGVVERIRQIRDDAKLAKNMRLANTSRLKEQFYWQKLCPQYINMYQQAAAMGHEQFHTAAPQEAGVV